MRKREMKKLSGLLKTRCPAKAGLSVRNRKNTQNEG
jgi:hypothetical protein